MAAGDWTGYDAFKGTAVTPDPKPTAADASSFAKQPGAAAQIKKRKRREKKRKAKEAAAAAAAAASSAGSGGGSATVNNNTGTNDNERSRPAPPPDPNNPLYTRFRTPKQLREEAARLAAIGAVPEETLRQQQAQQEANIGGLTSALTGTLGGLAERTQSGLRGIGSLYGQLANTAQSAGQSAAAAAGADTSIAPGASPNIVAQLANLAQPIQAYAPVAAATGAQLVGQSRGSLAKALMDRSARISDDTAKYLRQLQGEQYDKAVAQISAEQNATRLGLSAQESDRDYAVALSKLEQSNQALGIRAAELDRKIQKDLLDAGGDASKAQTKITDTLLKDAYKFTKPIKTAGKKEYVVTFDGEDKGIKVLANSAKGAAWQIRKQMPDGAYATNNYEARETGKRGGALPSRRDVEALFRARLVNSGVFTQAEANAWIRANALPLGLTKLPA